MYADMGPLSSQGKYLNGYLQTSKYFYDDRIKEEIKELFTHESILEESKSRYAYLLENKERVVVMHARRTDYLKAAGVHGPLTGAYYREAVQRIMGRVKTPIFLLCSDDQAFWNEIREDITPVFEQEHIVLEEDSDIRTFALLQQFHHFIMANSTFIWWCVWLSDAKNVMVPSKWFGPEGPTPYDDIFEENWERIE
jgi:hypothetical protein